MTAESVYYLTMADLYAVARDAIGDYQLRDPGLLASALARPQATVFGVGAYPTVLSKAASLLHSLANNRPLVDGNKRLAIASAMVFLARNGIDIATFNEELAYDLVITVASSEVDEVSELLGRTLAG